MLAEKIEAVSTKPALRLVAVPAPGDVSTYERLNALQSAAHALDRYITMYRDTPALPACADYRTERMKYVEGAIADMREALNG